jgi:hypothetical protein
MSGYEQGGEAASAGAAAASTPTAGEEQQSKQRALEEKIRELTVKIKEVETEIASDKAHADTIANDAERVEFRRAIAEDKKRLHGLEQDMRDLRKKIEQLESTVAGGCSPTSYLPLRSLNGLPRRVFRALLLLREFDSPFHLCARTATRPTRHFARVVRSPSVRVHHPSLCIDGVALSLPQRVRAASHLVHAPRGAADFGTWTLSYLVPTLALAHRLACLAGYCARSSCYENSTAPSTCAHALPRADIWLRNHAPLFGGSALSSCSACSPAPKSVRRLYPCVPRPPTFTRAFLCSPGVHRHQAASSIVICAHALPFRYALLRHAALIRHKSCLAMPPRGRIVTYPCPRLVDYMLYRVPAASITNLR